MRLAEHVSHWSKDPSTQVGAVIVRQDKTVASLGFNGFPRGVEDVNLEDRTYKYARIIHAEMNAILASKEDLSGYHLYVSPFAPCSSCASAIIQSGITKVTAPKIPEELKERWGDSLRTTKEMFEQAGVEFCEI